ncbi:CalY family protein [Vibrio sp. HS-50-1]|uniref:CalY family protein n=1 Tax=Vibrio sp. HS-50-1 TaxID=2945079 RepID=UPI00215FF181|nr:CalY family protein [Vibrio sp. HS-50-1]MCS0205212.1 CalY family protein [Vibrio sp. HS-50-1]
MGQVRENLPNGDPRNKIEYLADCIDDAKAASAESASDAPQNLLVNPELSHSGVDLAMGSPHQLRWLTNAYTYKDQAANQMHLGRSFGRPAPVGWGVEVVPIDGVSDYHSVAYSSLGGDIEKFDYTAKASYLLATGSNSRVLHFSVFSAPFDRELRALNDEGTAWVPENQSYSLFFRGEKNTAVRFGLLELDANGDFVGYVAQAQIPAEAGFNQFSQAWLHGIKLQAGGLYAYFVESDTSLGEFTSSPVSAGVFLNPDELDTIPDLTPSDTATRRFRLTESFGEFSKADVEAGVHLNVSKFLMPFGMEKHLIFASLKGTPGYYTVQNLPAEVVKTRYDQVSVRGTVADATTVIMAYYSESPVHLNYFSSVNYQAV